MFFPDLKTQFEYERSNRKDGDLDSNESDLYKSGFKKKFVNVIPQFSRFTGKLRVLQLFFDDGHEKTLSKQTNFQQLLIFFQFVFFSTTSILK